MALRMRILGCDDSRGCELWSLLSVRHALCLFHVLHGVCLSSHPYRLARLGTLALPHALDPLLLSSSSLFLALTFLPRALQDSSQCARRAS